MNSSGPRRLFGPDGPSVLWAFATGTAALLVSVADAALIGRTRGMFEGGFLSPEHLDAWSERALFAVVSIVSDAAVAGVLAAAALLCARWLRLRVVPATLFALIVAAGPLLLADVFSYELVSYLGDTFDLGLMFDLSGRSVREFLAVSSAHLVEPTILIGSAATATVLAVVWAQKQTSGEAIRGTPNVVVAIALLLAGFATQVWARTTSDILDDALRRKPTGKLFGVVAETVADLDGDGYGILRQPRDPAWRDPSIYPYAIDWPGDGVDQDGLAGDLPVTAAPYVEESVAAPSFTRRPNVLFVVLESFRADAVGASLNSMAVTPTMDALARAGASVREAYSHNGYTTRSRRHIFSGSLANLTDDGTLIDDFHANGYEVAYFSGQDESFGGDELSIRPERADVFYDARQDADRRYSTFTSAGSLAVPYDVVLERVSAFLRTRDRGKPLFLYVNFHDTHFPYWHRSIRPLVDRTVVPQGEISPARTADVRRMYLNTAANVDAAIGQLLTVMNGALNEEPAVVITSDHGESLFDEGFLGHGYALNQAQTRVPVIVKGLDVDIPRPFAQSLLRQLFRKALTSDATGTGPSIDTAEDGRVFQYLGSLERPRQIALTGLRAQTIYDFRENRARVGDSPWKSPSALTSSESVAYLELVQFWERLRLAQVRSEETRSRPHTTE